MQTCMSTQPPPNQGGIEKMGWGRGGWTREQMSFEAKAFYALGRSVSPTRHLPEQTLAEGLAHLQRPRGHDMRIQERPAVVLRLCSGIHVVRAKGWPEASHQAFLGCGHSGLV